MQLALDKSLPLGIIFPHQDKGNRYYLLFHEAVEGPFFVKTSDIQNSSLFYVGDVHKDSYTGPVVGYCFYSQVQHFSSGGIFCIAYTGVLSKKVETQLVKGHNFGVQLMLKTPHFFMWNKKGTLSLVVVPTLADYIKESLEA